ncbi:MAG: PIG-L family deacetylase, partial [Planctomycetes bacterium]|nr:PIG-L family deacetylase [Planctomycetota bacterium]
MSRRCLFLAYWIRTLCPLLAVTASAAAAIAAPGEYLGPIDVVASPDDATLYVVEYDGKRIDAIDVAAGKVARSIACPASPTGLALSADGSKLFVTWGGPEGIVGVVDAVSGAVINQIPVGHTPAAPVVSPDAKRLYVCNRFTNDVSVIDLATNKEIQRVPAIREPVSAAITSDGERLFVCNLLPVDPADSYDVAAEITVIDTGSLKTQNIRLLNGSSSVYGICISPDGKYAYVAHILSRYQMPTTQLERGWMNTNALSILDVAGKSLVNTVLLDDIDLGAGDLIHNIRCKSELLCVTLSDNQKNPLLKNVVKEHYDSMTELGVPKESIVVEQFTTRMFPDARQEILEYLLKLRKEFQPQIIFCHSPNDVHQDHNVVTQEALRAYRGITVLGFDVVRSSYNFFPHFFVGVEEIDVDKKIEALQKYKTYHDKYY